MLIKEVNERECKVSLLKLSFLKKVTAILVISALVMFTAVASAGGPPCTCGDICVNETGWWRDGGAFNASGTPIQDAVNNAHSGETICVKDGMYTENVDVNVANLTIISENGSTSCIVQAASTRDHIFEVTADYVNITGFTAKGATRYEKAGIYLDDVEHCDISDIKASNNYDGIYMSHSRYNNLMGNNASNNKNGIYLLWLSNNNLTNNTVSNNHYGIYLCASSSNNFTGNTFVNDGLFVSSGYHNTVENNTVNGKPLVYREDTSDYMVPDAGQVILVNCNNVTVENRDLSNTTVGVELWETTNSTITNNTVSNNNYGILLDSSINNTLTSNNASNNDFGIWLYYSSNNNTLTSNTASNNRNGIYLYSSSNTLTNNTANSNNGCGIALYSSSNNTLTDNTASNNGFGIGLYSSSYNNLTSNTANSNNHDGIRLYKSSNTLTNNTVSNNECGIYLELSSSNILTGNNASNNANYDFYSDEVSHNNNIQDLTMSSYPTMISFIYDNGIGIKSVTTPETDPDGKVNIGKYVNLTDVTEDSWILLNISYNDADVTNLEEDSLRLYRWNETEWGEIPGSNVNTAKNYVYANVTSFSQIAPFGDPKTPEVTIYVPDNHTTIQAAVDNASAGDTIIVRDGTYTENVNVAKQLTIRSENGSDSTIVNAAYSMNHVFNVSTDYVNINGFTVKGATEEWDGSGIFLYGAEYCNISDNNVSNNWAGISLYNSSNNTIKNNAVNSNFEIGIILEFWSNCNTITNNIASTNGVGIGLGRFTSSNILTNNIASNNGDGIRLYSSSDNKLTNNNASNNNYGIYLLLHSNNNTITGNTAFNNTGGDFYSDERSHDNSIDDFTISSYPTTISFIYEHGIVIKAVAAPEPDPAGKANIGKYVNVTNKTEDSWILLNVSYSDADVAHVEEASLRLYRSTETEWEEIPGSNVNTAENYVYANVTSFSQIAPFGNPISTPTPRPHGGGGEAPRDSDGDGISDIDEMLAGTDLNDPREPNPECAACLAIRPPVPTPSPKVMPTPTPTATPTIPPTVAPSPSPTPLPTPKPGIPGFEAVLAIAGLLAVAYLALRRKQ